MNRPDLSLVQPRKTARQARSIATTEAIQQATIQVLLAEGVGRLTTTRVAERAGVSVGTLYQYFPHKQALLFGVVERQIGLIEKAMRAACERLTGCDLAMIAEGLSTAWLDAKTADTIASRAIYGIAAEFDLSSHMGRAATLMRNSFEVLLASAPGVRFRDPPAAAFMLAALLGGSVRMVMEADPSSDSLDRLRSELPRACYAYLCSASAPA
ncbi:TetR/AcrR family transcriptional regulator [Brevundimonas sp. UBA7534]|uniref:TetR/AcrR family transcriptional regulator n=1 Tax=Brevundimonas sp. UBA7534 TaxID=1946138 RepID=UPI0025C04973|nr:TetR/AcrR family transcriptional regulator [Brevundimonas sp. UBA7534]